MSTWDHWHSIPCTPDIRLKQVLFHRYKRLYQLTFPSFQRRGVSSSEVDILFQLNGLKPIQFSTSVLVSGERESLIFGTASNSKSTSKFILFVIQMYEYSADFPKLGGNNTCHASFGFKRLRYCGTCSITCIFVGFLNNRHALYLLCHLTSSSSNNKFQLWYKAQLIAALDRHSDSIDGDILPMNRGFVMTNIVIVHICRKHFPMHHWLHNENVLLIWLKVTYLFMECSTVSNKISTTIGLLSHEIGFLLFDKVLWSRYGRTHPTYMGLIQRCLLTTL